MIFIRIIIELCHWERLRMRQNRCTNRLFNRKRRRRRKMHLTHALWIILVHRFSNKIWKISRWKLSSIHILIQKNIICIQPSLINELIMVISKRQWVSRHSQIQHGVIISILIEIAFRSLQVNKTSHKACLIRVSFCFFNQLECFWSGYISSNMWFFVVKRVHESEVF